MEDREKYIHLRNVFINIVLFVVTVVLVTGGSFLYTRDWTRIIRNGVISCVCVGTILFLLAEARVHHTYREDNEEHPLRFAVSFLIGVVLCVLLPILPAAGWPYVVVFVTLTLFSNPIIGIVSSSYLLLISVLLQGDGSLGTFCLYFVSGVLCSVLFKKLDEDFKIGYPMLITVMVLVLCETANIVLFINETLRFELLIIPFVGVVISAILILIVLKVYGQLIVFKYRERFLNINDTECPLMIELKEKQPELYMHTIHVAYLSERISTAIGTDNDCVKTLSYYQKIATLKGEVNWANTLEVIEDYEFPSNTYEYLKDIIENQAAPLKKETFVVLVAEMIISSIEYLYAKNPNKEIQYDQVITTLIKKKLESVFPQKCGITYKEADIMKKVLLEEKLYYDFILR